MSRYIKFEMIGPDGSKMETMAVSHEKAWNNLRARLHYQHGMSWYAAGKYDHSDLREVS